jgi:Na+-driven multidrug efflux pump
MKKRGIISDYLPWLLIGVAILAILMISIYFLRGEGITMIDKIKDLFKFR